MYTIDKTQYDCAASYYVVCVSVPPKVIDEESSMDIIVKEGSDMILQCKARGYPEPYIMWRREDGLDINYNGITGKNDMNN